MSDDPAHLRTHNDSSGLNLRLDTKWRHCTYVASHACLHLAYEPLDPWELDHQVLAFGDSLHERRRRWAWSGVLTGRLHGDDLEGDAENVAVLGCEHASRWVQLVAHSPQPPADNLFAEELGRERSKP